MIVSSGLKSTVFRLIVGLLLFVGVVVMLAKSFNVDDVLQALSVFPLTTLAILLLASLLVSFLKGTRFHVLVRHVGIDIRFWKTLRLFLASQAATPIPAGETIRAALLKQETGASLGKVASPVLGQAIYEIAAAVGVVFVASLFYPELFIPSLVAVVALVAIIWILLHRKLFNRLLEILSHLPLVERHFDRIRNGREHFRHNFALLEEDGFDRHVLASIVLAFVAQLMGGLLVAIAAHAFDIPLNFFQATLVYASGAILQGVFTFIPGGFGVTEGGMSGILHLLGVELSLALALVIIIRLATLVFPVSLGFIIFALFYAKQTFSSKKPRA